MMQEITQNTEEELTIIVKSMCWKYIQNYEIFENL